MNRTRAFRLLLVGALMTIALAACSGGGAAAAITPPPEADLTITAERGSFEPSEIAAPAGTSFEMFFRNLDPAPHNVSIFTDASVSESRFVGGVITDASTVYRVPALEAGSYFFRCDVHPEMTGTLVARFPEADLRR